MAISTSIISLTHIELLVKLCSEEDDEAVYNEFVKRFLPELTKECHRISERRKLDQHIGTQIAHECCEKLRKYKSFKADEVKVNNSHKAVMGYLYRFAVNLFNDHQRSIERKKNVVVNKTYFDNILEDRDGETDPVKLQLLKEKTLTVFNQLNYREQRVLQTDLEYKRSQRYLPDDVLELLATELCVKKDTVRKIRERVIRKIKTALNAI